MRIHRDDERERVERNDGPSTLLLGYLSVLIREKEFGQITHRQHTLERSTDGDAKMKTSCLICGFRNS